MVRVRVRVTVRVRVRVRVRSSQSWEVEPIGSRISYTSPWILITTLRIGSGLGVRLRVGLGLGLLLGPGVMSYHYIIPRGLYRTLILL